MSKVNNKVMGVLVTVKMVGSGGWWLCEWASTTKVRSGHQCYMTPGFSYRPVHLSFRHPILILDTLKFQNLLQKKLKLDTLFLHRMGKSSNFGHPISKTWLNPAWPLFEMKCDNILIILNLS